MHEPSLCIKHNLTQLKTVQRIHMADKLTEVYISLFESCPRSMGQAADVRERTCWTSVINAYFWHV